MSKRLCNVCGKVPLHHDNKSGVCRGCKAAQAVDGKSLGAGEKPESVLETAAKVEKPHHPRPKPKPAKDGHVVLERTDKEPKKPFTGLNLLVVEALDALGGSAPIAAIADHMRKRSAFKESKQEPDKAARWHAWFLRKHGFLRKAR
jgi:hypothetical protein